MHSHYWTLAKDAARSVDTERVESSQRAPVPDAVLSAFGIRGGQTRLAGGEGRSVRVGDVVLKPVDDVSETAWLAALLRDLRVPNVRIPRPVITSGGDTVVDGWAAVEFVTGATEPRGRWSELIAASRRFHRALASVPRPGFIDSKTHQWATADRVAWDQTTATITSATEELLHAITQRLRPTRAASQLVHGDLSGNVLFADDRPPAIIDLALYWRPVAYAEAIVVVDALLWYDADASVLDVIEPAEAEQMLLRALIFRLLADDLAPGWAGTSTPLDRYSAVAAILPPKR